MLKLYIENDAFIVSCACLFSCKHHQVDCVICNLKLTIHECTLKYIIVLLNHYLMHIIFLSF